MGYITVNLGDVDQFEAIPGNEWYGVEVTSVEVRENKEGTGLYLHWEFTVIDGDYENRKLWWNTSLQDHALFGVTKAFIELGVADEDEEIEIEHDDDIEPSSKAGPQMLYPEVEGLECSVYVKNRMWDGKEQNEIKDIRGERSPNRSKKKKRSRSSVEDDRPRSSSRSNSRKRDDEDDYDERPTRRSRRDEDDEEEMQERPRRRSSTKQRRRIR